MTAIEKLREQVEEVRREHRELPARYGRNAGRCALCWPSDKSWPCPTLSWAEKCLRLAEALDEVPCDCYDKPHTVDDMFCHRNRALSVLAEVTR